MTAIGVEQGHFKTFEAGVAPVTLAGGSIYHRVIAADSGSHPIRWYLYDPSALAEEAKTLKLPPDWIDAVYDALLNVNPFIPEFETLSQSQDDTESLAIQLQYPAHVTANEVAAVVSLDPAGEPSPRTFVIRRKGGKDQFLDHTSPLIEPMHYVLLFPHGTLGWFPKRLNTKGKSLSQQRWFRSRFFLNAERLSVFSRLTGDLFFNAANRSN